MNEFAASCFCRGPRHVEIVGPEGLRSLLRCILHVGLMRNTESQGLKAKSLGSGNKCSASAEVSKLVLLVDVLGRP